MFAAASVTWKPTQALTFLNNSHDDEMIWQALRWPMDQLCTRGHRRSRRRSRVQEKVARTADASTVSDFRVGRVSQEENFLIAAKVQARIWIEAGCSLHTRSFSAGLGARTLSLWWLLSLWYLLSLWWLVAMLVCLNHPKIHTSCIGKLVKR